LGAAQRTAAARRDLSDGVSNPIAILLLEDSPLDAELVEAMLRQEGFLPDIKRVLTEADFRRELESSNPDLIISDYSLPSYSGRAALSLARSIAPEIPFLFYSGTIGEEAAIEALRMGAIDYVLKDKPRRLVSAIQRALDDARRKKQQRAADEKIAAQAQLLDLATDAIVVCDLADRVQFWNDGAVRLYGWESAEVVGKKIGDFMPLSFMQGFLSARKATLEQGHWEGEMEHLSRNEKPIVVTSRWTLVNDSTGRPARFLLINTDSTERKQLEKQFLRAQRLESIGTLASGIAHDLNNILAPIFMASGILEESALPEEAAQMVEMIKRSAERGAEVVKQVLTFVRGSDGKRVPLNVTYILKEISKVARETFPKDIEVHCVIGPDLATVSGDPTRIHQVLMNLCVNARDAMPQGGKLFLRARNAADQPNPSVLLEVEDTGTGIPADLIDKIFDPFFTTKAPSKGTGLGLSTVMGIVKSHNGTLKLDTKEGAGTKFQIFLPAVLAAEPSDSAHTAPPIPRGSGELILVVDDEEPIRRLVAQTCDAHGYDTISAVDGASAVVQFAGKRNQIKVVITDMLMPGVNGKSLAATIRSLSPSTKIIAITGAAEQNSVPDADSFITKPFGTPELLREVHRVLHNPR
jgi:two-component system cell cycle sensor histidine kinase/response regulator CckA